MKKLKWVMWLVLLCVLLGGGIGIWRMIVTSMAGAPYRTETIQKGNLTQTVSANGTLNPVILVNVGTQISGKVEKIYADFNDHVTAGQVLLELDKRLLEAALEESKAAVNKAKATLVLAKANETRGVALRKKGFISIQDTSFALS